MPLSYQEITNPSSTSFTVNFEFLNLADIKAVGKQNSGSTWTELSVTNPATNSSGVTTVTVANAGTYSSAGAVRIYRASTQTPLVDFQSGSRLSETDLDTAYRQGLFAAQEVRENAKEDIAVQGPVGAAGAAGADGADAVITAGSIANDKLENSSVTINGSAVPLGGSTTVGGGKIGQVVQSVKTDNFSTTSTSYVDVTGVTASITPTSTSSKVLVTIQGSTNNSTASSELTRLKLLRGSTAIGVANTTHDSFFNTYGASNVAISFTTLLLDSPATTSSVTYKLQVKQSGNSTAYVGGFGPNSEAITTITLMEVLP